VAKASIPKGTRDFLPHQMIRRNYIFDTIRSVFKNYGYLPIETPAMEKTETLLGKYGEEGDRLIFKVLRRGEKLDKALSSREKSALSEEALRYDLTVPFARLVVQHQNEIAFPFKRYQIQPVWRADRPQKGRYREFYQCDVDVVGSDSLLYEVELIQIFDEVLSNLGLTDFTIKINNRKILSGIAEVSGESERLTDITVAIDKLDKIGAEKVKLEMLGKGVSNETVERIVPLFEISGDRNEKLEALVTYLEGSEMGQKGIEELKNVFQYVDALGLTNAKLEFDPVLARGLNYYTGAIFEVKAGGVNIGSICGGGRYDNLTGIFGLPNVSGVGISFGADRIYDVLEELNLWPPNLDQSVDVIFINFGEKESSFVLPWLKKVRSAGISAEIYPTSAKIQKQMKYANAKGCKYVAMIGDKEMSNNNVVIKNMENGEQKEVDLNEMTEFLKRPY